MGNCGSRRAHALGFLLKLGYLTQALECEHNKYAGLHSAATCSSAAPRRVSHLASASRNCSQRSVASETCKRGVSNDLLRLNLSLCNTWSRSRLALSTEESAASNPLHQCCARVSGRTMQAMVALHLKKLGTALDGAHSTVFIPEQASCGGNRGALSRVASGLLVLWRSDSGARVISRER